MQSPLPTVRAQILKMNIINSIFFLLHDNVQLISGCLETPFASQLNVFSKGTFLKYFHVLPRTIEE